MKKNKKFYNSYNIGGVMNLANAGMQLGSVASGNTSENGLTSAVSGIATGAQAGATFGPWGAAVGGVIGGVAGAVGSAKAKKEAHKLALDSQRKMIDSNLNSGGIYAAYGGSLNSSSNIQTKFNSFDEGGTHEQNPLGGIPQGVGENGKPNFVEQGETSYKFKDGTKFIFSDRIKFKK